MKLTITKQNYFRYEHYIKTISTEEPYVIFNAIEVNDAAGNGNHAPDYNETRFSASSSRPGRIGFRVITRPFEVFPHTQTGNSGGQVQGFSFLRKAFLTMRSSREWKVMMQSRPPGASRSIIVSSESSSTSSSRLQAMRIA